MPLIPQNAQTVFDRFKAAHTEGAYFAFMSSRNLPFLASFFSMTFLAGREREIGEEALSLALEDFIERLDPKDRPSGNPKNYLRQWVDSGFLFRLIPEGGDEEPLFRLTPGVEKALDSIDDAMRERRSTGTEARYRRILDTVEYLAGELEPNAHRKIERLKKQRLEIDEKISILELAGREESEEPSMSPRLIKETISHVAEDARKLLRDFGDVTENLKSVNEEAVRHMAERRGRKDVLTQALDAVDFVRSSDQGVSLEAFYHLLSTGARQEDLSDLLNRIEALFGVSGDEDFEFLEKFYDHLFFAADAAMRTKGRLIASLARYLESEKKVSGRMSDLGADVLEGFLSLAKGLDPDRLKDFEWPAPLAAEPDIVVPAREPFSPPPRLQKLDSLSGADAEEGDLEFLYRVETAREKELAAVVRKALDKKGPIRLSEVLDIGGSRKPVQDVVTLLIMAEKMAGDDGQLVEVEIDDGERVISLRNVPNPLFENNGK